MSRKESSASGPTSEKRILSQDAPGKDHFHVGAGKFGRYIHGVRDDGKIRDMLRRPGHRRAGSARIEDNHLAGLYQLRRGRGDSEFFLPMQPLFFVQRWIAQRGRIERKRSAMCALDAALLVKMFQILADCNQ